MTCRISIIAISFIDKLVWRYPMRSALPIAYVVLRILILLNWLGGASIFALLTATIVAEQWTFTALGITPGSAIPAMIMGLRGIAALGLVAVLLNNAVLKRLVAI